MIDDNEKNYATLDEVLDFISKTNNAKIPQENVNIMFHKTTVSKNALEFLQWIITKGQEYNRQFGFINLDKTVVGREQAFVTGLLNNAGNTSLGSSIKATQ